MLTPIQQKLWEAYELAEGRASRAEKLIALEAFCDSLATLPEPEWFPWARSIAEQVVDGKLDFVIRRPMFERVVFPALLAGYRAALPGCARWLAGLWTVHHCSPVWQKQLPNEGTEIGLLREAINLDPADRRSKQALIKKIADRLTFSLHEIPAGVLYGIDGASPQQCLELNEELEFSVSWFRKRDARRITGI